MRIFETIGIALLAILIWELLRRAGLWVHAVSRERIARAKLFEFEGHTVLSGPLAAGDEGEAGSAPADEVPAAVTDRVTARVAARVTTSLERGGTDLAVRHATSNVIVIGSPAQNGAADDLQRAFDLPFQYAVTTAGRPGVEKAWSIITGGEETLASEMRAGDPVSRAQLRPADRVAGAQASIDYGILFFGTLPTGRKVLWISALHDAGLQGVLDFLEENAVPIREALDAPGRDDDGLAWLIRIACRTEADADGRPAGVTIESTEALGEPLPAHWRGRGKPRALVCDLGRVIVDFDRNRTYRAFAKRLGTPAEELRARVDATDLLLRYESGAIDDDAFYDELVAVLGGDGASLPRDFVDKFYADIFTPIHEVIAALAHLRREEGLPLVLLSNTCPLHYSWIADDCADAMGLFEHAVLSFDRKVMKPDEEIFRVALEKALASCGKVGAEPGPADVLYVDDIGKYVDVAESLGMRGIVYSSYPRFVFSLRKSGLYVP